jgi:NAD(P)-dependent dehydrogenase (short-subunit alcohol dehydrogenase family)
MSENSPLVALIHGADSTLGRAVALELARHNVLLLLAGADVLNDSVLAIESELSTNGVRAVALDDPRDAPVPEGMTPEKLLVTRAADVFGRLDALINLFVPVSSTTVQFFHEYPARLLDRGLEAARLITSFTGRGSIVNHCIMPAMFAGTCLEQEMPMLKGAITGVTRTLCRKFGPQGLRANTVQTGLIDMPEARSLASPKVAGIKPPVGRWGTPEEVAKFVAFLVVRNGYMTGQAVIMDGGMTAGITGT